MDGDSAPMVLLSSELLRSCCVVLSVLCVPESRWAILVLPCLVSLFGTLLRMDTWGGDHGQLCSRRQKVGHVEEGLFLFWSSSYAGLAYSWYKLRLM